MRLAMLVNFLLTRISLHTGLQFRGRGAALSLARKGFGGVALTFAGNKLGCQISFNLV